MIDALAAGRLYGAPVARTAKSGNKFVTAKVRAATRDGESLFVNIVAFSESAIAALLALEDGSTVSLSGELTAKAYTGKDGAPKPSLELLVHHVLTPFHVSRKRQAMSGARKEPEVKAQGESRGSGDGGEFDSDIPF